MSVRKYFVLTFRFIKTWQKSLFVAVFTMKNTFKQVFQVILRIYVVQLSIREKMNTEFSAAPSLSIFIQFLSSNFTSFILCSHRLFESSAALSLRIFFRDSFACLRSPVFSSFARHNWQQNNSNEVSSRSFDF